MTAPADLRCRGCGASHLEPVLDLGSVPLANSLLTEAEVAAGAEERFPLKLLFCPSCALVQIGETVIPDRLFRHYLYASSFSDTMLRHAKVLADRLATERELGPGSLVVEVASNDGYLLQNYQRRGIPVLGIEPAENIAKVAVAERNIPTLTEFFGSALAGRLAAEGRLADVVHAHNVLAHVPDPSDFVAGLKLILKPDGIALIEVPYVVDLIRKLEFDTIYHEHFSYFSVVAVLDLLRRQSLDLLDVDWVPIHGGSLRLVVGHVGRGSPSERVAEMITVERQDGVDRVRFYAGFAGEVDRLRRDLLAELRRLKSEGKSIAAYGASAKGSTLMNGFGIDGALVDFVVDRSTLKQGLFTPGNHLPILPPEALLERRPDFALLLTWNFAEEILAQQADYRAAGGRFIVPIPSVEIV